jgi:CheY-like chemotaxis protein
VRHIDHSVASRIIFVTGGASESVQRALAALPNLVLRKPIAVQELRDAVRQIVER